MKIQTSDSSRLSTKEMILLLAGLLLFGLSYFLFPVRTLANIASNSFYFISLALSGCVMLAIVHLAGGKWIAPIKPLMVAIFKLLPWLAIPILFLYLNFNAIYPWGDHDYLHHGGHHVSASKATYLSTWAFTARWIGFFALWIFVGRKFLSVMSSAKTLQKKTLWSVLFIACFAFTYSLFSVDWLMSITPHWFSSIYPYYCFAGLLQLSMAWACYLIIGGQRLGIRFTEDLTKVKYDLASLLFGFSCLWAYLWVSQFLLIWYGNIPLEVEYFIVRLQDQWKFWFYLNPVLTWLLPFLILLRKPWKQSDRMVLFVASLVIIGRWLDFYLLVSPDVFERDPLSLGLGALDIILFAIYATMAVVIIRWNFLRQKNTIVH